MFNKMKDMGNLVKKAKEMKDEMKRVQNELKDQKVLGENKQKTVKVLLTGELNCVGLQISPEALLEATKDEKKKKALEKAITEAFNQSAEKAKTLASGKLSKISQGLNIPGLT
mgnify:CR=1 FL=1